MNLKMEVYSPDLELLGILEIYRSLIFEECAFKSGSFSVESLITKDILALLSPENILWIADDVAGIVEHIEESADDSGPYFTAKGRLLTGILDRRILWGAYNMYGSPDKIMRNLVTDCAIAPTRGDTEARKIPHLVLAGDSPTPASRLPAGYVELEYIQSTGTQYIDTEFVPKNTTKVASQFKLISASSHYFSIFGVEGSDGYKGYTIFGVDGQNNVQGIYWNQYFNVAGAAYSQTAPNYVEMGNGTITFDDVTQTLESSTFTCETSIYLFCNNKYSANGTSYPQYLCSAAIYNFSIYDSDNLVRDFVPCKNPAGTVGLYDLVGQKFYTNAGTGEFTAGPSVNLKSYAASKSLSAIRKQKTGGSLQETLEEIGEANQVAYGVRLNAQIPQMEFWTRQGVDRTVSQSENEPVFYSTELDDVLSSEYFYDSSSYRNIALVAGEGEGADRMLVTVENTDESAPVPPSPPTPPTPPTPVTKYTVTLSVDPQGSGVASGGGSVESGKSVTVTATASSGYEFAGWRESGTIVSTSASYTFTVNANRTLTAVFAVTIPVYTITASIDPAGSGTVTGTGQYQEGETCTLTATVDDGYTFTGWQEGGVTVSESAEYSFVVTGNRVLVAAFAEKPVSRLPEGYTEVAYIQSAGSAYLSHGLYAAYYRIVMDIEPTELSSSTRYIFGGNTYNSSSKLDYYYYLSYNSGGILFRVGDSKTSNVTTATTDATPRRMRIDFDPSNDKISVNDEEKTLSQKSILGGSRPLYLLNCYKASTTPSPIPAKLFSCQIYNSNGTLARDYVPCVNESGVAGVYDLVNNSFVASASTTAFTPGPAI